jgi:murein tripeptide amidase MpaA
MEQWISAMVIEYLAYQLIDGYKSGDGNVTAFLDYYDFYLVPFHNPDGTYNFSHNNIDRSENLWTHFPQASFTLRPTTAFGARTVNHAPV